MEFEALRQAVIEGNAAAVESGVEAGLEAGVAPETLLYDVLIPAMGEVGALYEAGEFFVPEMLVAAHAMKAGLAILRPKLTGASAQTLGVVVLGTVQGDLHDIGKNLVGLMLEGAGFEVRDLGVDVAPERFVAAVKDNVQIIGLSALLTTTMPAMKASLEALVEAGVRDRVKVMVGGAPVTQSYADEIGADGYAPDAASAVRLAKSLLNM